MYVRVGHTRYREIVVAVLQMTRARWIPSREGGEVCICSLVSCNRWNRWSSGQYRRATMKDDGEAGEGRQDSARWVNSSQRNRNDAEKIVRRKSGVWCTCFLFEFDTKQLYIYAAKSKRCFNKVFNKHCQKGKTPQTIQLNTKRS